MISAKNVRLVALDLDGTLLHPDNTVSPRARAALAAARQRGVRVVLVTGRMHRSALPIALGLGLEGEPLISYNGACTRLLPGGEILHEQPLPAELARAVAAWAEERGHYVQAYVNDEFYVPELNDLAVAYSARVGVPARPVGPISRWLEQPSHKLLIIGEDAAIAAAQAGLGARFTGQVELYRSRHPGGSYLEIVAPGANKGTALAAVCARLGVSPEQVLAAGDAENDLPMLAWAGVGVAMPGADERVRAAAVFVPSSAYGDGVAEALARFVLD